MEIKDSLLPTSVTYSGESLSSDAKLSTLSEINEISDGKVGDRGARFDGQVLGSFGKYGVLSFNGNKMITTSGGGALICLNADEGSFWLCAATLDADCASSVCKNISVDHRCDFFEEIKKYI